MTPEQLRALADKFQASEPPPSMRQTIPDYCASDTAHKMARFLRELAQDAEPRSTASGYLLAKLCGCGGPADPEHISGCPHAPRTRGTAPA